MTKLAAFALSPLGVLFLLLAVAGWCVWTDRRWGAVWVLVGTGLWMYLWSCPWVAGRVTGWWEARYPPVPVEDLPRAAVAVTLGGVINGPAGPQQHPDLNDAADRLWHAARVYRAGKVQAILVSGGGRGATPEAESSVPFLLALGVPRDAILLETTSLDTIGNARASAQVLREHRVSHVLLVTSAAHMPRAMQAFRHVRLVPYPVSTDLAGGAGGRHWLDWLPSADALRMSTRTIKEIIGTGWYKLAYRASGA